MGFASKNNKTNLFAKCTWENNLNALFSTFNTSIQGESIMKSPASIAGSGLHPTDMKNSKIYHAIWDYQNLSDATAYPYVTTASLNTTKNGQLLVASNNIPTSSTLTRQALSICYAPETYPWVKLGNGTSAGQSFKAVRPRLYEDRNWTDNIVNYPIDNAVQNGDFATDTSGWTNQTAYPATLSVDTGRLKILALAGSPAFGSAIQTFNTIIGKRYNYSVDYTAETECYVRIGFTSSNFSDYYSSVVLTGSGTVTGSFVALANKTTIRLVTAPNRYALFDNITITQATLWSKLKNHFRADCCTVNSITNETVPTVYNTLETTATQTTETKQPIHIPQPQLNQYNKDYLNFDGVDDTLLFTENIVDSFDLWFVAKNLPTSVPVTAALFSKGTGSSASTNIEIDFNTGLRLFYYNIASQAIITLASSQYPPSTGINFIRVKFNTAEGSKLYLNNKLVGTNSDVTLPQNTTTNCYFNSRCNSGGYLNSKLYEYLSFTQLTDNEASQVLKYLRRRYGDEANF